MNERYQNINITEIAVGFLIYLRLIVYIINPVELTSMMNEPQRWSDC